MLMQINNFNTDLGNQFVEYNEAARKAMQGTNPNNAVDKKAPFEKIKQPIDAIDYIASLYEDGYGLKIIARHLGMTYTSIRTAFKRCNIEIRKGQNVVTDKVKQFRREQALTEINPWKNWPEHHPEWTINSNTGIMGHYIKNNGEKVWLRSSWEYVYAKWLDNNNIDYKVEERTYTLSDGSTYRPDFFIYNNGVLEKVVEIKGAYDRGGYKPALLQQEYGITTILIKDITPYMWASYGLILNEWKEYVKA